jgi:hypothetical protein
MKRRSRSGVADYTDETSKMTRVEIDSEIQRCLWGAENGGTSQSRKAFFKRLMWLEQQREKHFGVIAPRRVFRQR